MLLLLSETQSVSLVLDSNGHQSYSKNIFVISENSLCQQCCVVQQFLPSIAFVSTTTNNNTNTTVTLMFSLAKYSQTHCLRAIRNTSNRYTASHFAVRMVHIESKLQELGYVLPKVSSPAANYVMVNQTGNLLHTAGHISIYSQMSIAALPETEGVEVGKLITGKLGKDLSVQQGYLAAKECGLNLLASLKEELGDLDRVEKIVKVVGFVNCADTFIDQPKVINGVSDLLGEVFGEKGRHARSAVGVNTLPLGVAVEVELIAQVKP